MYPGELTAVPEPATMLLVGSVLGAEGFVSRKAIQTAPEATYSLTGAASWNQ